jgi:hypothetical protein
VILFAALNLAAMAASPAIARGIMHIVQPASACHTAEVAAFMLNIVVYALPTMLQLGHLDPLVRALERTRILRRVFTASFTRRYRGYLAPGFKPNQGI